MMTNYEIIEFLAILQYFYKLEINHLLLKASGRRPKQTKEIKENLVYVFVPYFLN